MEQLEGNTDDTTVKALGKVLSSGRGRRVWKRTGAGLKAKSSWYVRRNSSAAPRMRIGLTRQTFAFSILIIGHKDRLTSLVASN
jgi:hypothetical protein